MNCVACDKLGLFGVINVIAALGDYRVAFVYLKGVVLRILCRYTLYEELVREDNTAR